MFWGRILDVVPVAHNTVLKDMTDAVVVLDRHHRIANLNPSARHLLGLDNFHVIGCKSVKGDVMLLTRSMYIENPNQNIQRTSR